MVKEKPAERALPILREARANAASKEARAGFDLAMARALSNLEQHDELREVATRLLEAFPNSATAFEHLTEALARLGRLEELEQSADRRLERLPNDPAAIRALATASHLKKQYGKAMLQWERLVSLGKSKPKDLNRFAWEALLAGTATQKTVETFQTAAFLPKEKEKDKEKAETLFTLAALFAELEKTTEARTSLLEAMNTEGLEEPDSKSWYVFGRIAEQYGEPAAAAAAYRQVKPPKKQGISVANSAYLLAKRRLEQLIKEKKVGAS
jgi:tetratricopeptide (TPR) repeat protein